MEIETEDLCIFHGDIGSKGKFSLSMDYLSHITYREILVITDNFTIIGDIVKNTIVIRDKNEEEFKNHFDFDIIDTYLNLHQNILYEKQPIACSFNEGCKIIEIIRGMRNE